MKDELLTERFELCLERLRQIPEESAVPEPFGGFFRKEAVFLLSITDCYRELQKKDRQEETLEQMQARNRQWYEELFPENYAACYGNPDYACEKLGPEYGPLFGALYAELRGVIVFACEDRLWDLVTALELFLECYLVFEDPETPSEEVLKQILVSYQYDYCAAFVDYRTAQLVDPSMDFATRIIMTSDLADLRYLYRFGEYVSDNEFRTAEFLNTLPQEEIDRMASTLTEGYRQGFIVTGKDLGKKKTVNIRFCLGFERMVRSMVLQFRQMGLESIIYRTAAHLMNRRQSRSGYFGGDPNPQFSFDHRNDDAVWLDDRMVSRKLAALHEAFEKRKELSNTHAGPAIIEVFGEKPFVPEVKKTAFTLSKEQQALRVKYDMESAQLTNRYIIGEERSFSIIAYPVPEIGDAYPEIFRETVRINTLDYRTYQRIQQYLVDALDEGQEVRITGRGGNETDLTVRLQTLRDPETETNFENCVADVNIPVGEVFTSPQLQGTNGLLHVSKVYLDGFCYRNLRIRVKDGMTESYSCDNFEDPQDGKTYIFENILFNHESLPMGEFAIGTNTTAYAAAEKFGIADKLPILIAEKMGPHFAFGDTCYSWEEDVVTRNPDGKAIVARENECSALRKTDISRAYFNCHTDITIPYSELGDIYAVLPGGEKRWIIRAGRFVLEGTQELNTPLETVPEFGVV